MLRKTLMYFVIFCLNDRNVNYFSIFLFAEKCELKGILYFLLSFKITEKSYVA
jgi:hypothetical protein